MVHTILENGLQVLYHPMPNTHSVTIGLYVKAGLAYGDEKHLPGITHLLEHLHFRHLKDYTQDELYYKMESLGSTLRAATYRDFLKFTMKVTPDKVMGCMDIFCNLLETSTWTEEDLIREKLVVINQIYEDGNYISTEKEVRKAVFKKPPLAQDIMGTVEDVKAISEEDIEKYKKSVFTFGNLLLCITGNVDEKKYEAIVKMLQERSPLPKVEEKKVEYPDCFHRRKPKVVLVPIHDEELLSVNISFDIGYDEQSKPMITILNSILGEGVGSRLQRRVREQEYYSSDIYSYLEWYQNFAVLHITFSVMKRQLYPCLEEIMKILKGMKYTIMEKDLETSLPFYMGNRVFYEDDTEEMNYQLVYDSFVLGLKESTMKFENHAAMILQLQNLAKEIFVTENMCTVIVGDTSKMKKKSIRKLGRKIS